MQPILADSLLAFELAAAARKALGAPAGGEAAAAAEGDAENGGAAATEPWNEAQEPVLLHLIAAALEVQVEQIADFELNLYDTQRAALGGAHGELLCSNLTLTLTTDPDPDPDPNLSPSPDPSPYPDPRPYPDPNPLTLPLTH